MPTIPVGDVLRAIVPTRWKWLRAILSALKGTKIQKGDLEILLENRPSLGDDVNAATIRRPHSGASKAKGKWER